MSGQPVVDGASLAGRIGRRLRQLRQERGLTLTALSTRSGMSVSYLSAVETGVNHPSLQTLVAITDALGVRIPDVLAEEGQVHVRQGQVPTDGSAIVEVSHPVLQLRSSLVAATPGDRGASPVLIEARDLFVYVVEGKVRVQIGEVTHTLCAGDALDAKNPGEVSWISDDRSITSWTSCPTRIT